MEDRIFQILVEQNDFGWKSLIYDLIRSENMDPWDVDVSLLSQKYVARLKQFKESDLKLSGKVLLAAAILLKIKSKKLVGEDMNEFDKLLQSADQDQFYDELEQELKRGEQTALEQGIVFELEHRLPQPRKRKVSVFELVKALEKALEVKKRRFDRIITAHVDIPERKFDITVAIKGIYDKILGLLGRIKKLTFSDITPSEKKEDKIYTFIPLLYLSNQNKVELIQERHFGEIEIKIVNNSVVEKEGDNNAVKREGKVAS